MFGTAWETADIWLRGTFNLERDMRGHDLMAMTYHDEDVEIYINGVLAAKAAGRVTAPYALPIGKTAVGALHLGLNVIAVHCHQTDGDQGVSVVLCGTD